MEANHTASHAPSEEDAESPMVWDGCFEEIKEIW
jgi:hypothetical protein